jgi:hypothetical protein
MVVPSSEIIRIEPRDSIKPPYDDCPACGARDELGLVTVTATGYLKRCHRCMGAQTFDLPTLAPKRVLYLDQLAISNLLKTRLPAHQHKFADDNPATQFGFWPRLLNQLERLVHLNLLVCPRSSIHDLEAAFNDRLSGGLRSFHEQLAGNVKLAHHASVKSDQLERACRAWLEDREPGPLDTSQVVYGHLDGWLDRFIVNAYYPVTPDEISKLRDGRDRVDQDMQDSFRCWAQMSSPGFDVLFRGELEAYGPGLMKPDYSGSLMIGLRAQLEDHGVAPEQWPSQIDAFLQSEAPTKVYFAEIAAGMLAALAWRAGHNQLARPTRGLRADIQAISTYLPYVDAMFVDNECARLLRDEPLRDQLPCSTRIFSIDSRGELLEWLTEIEDQAPPGHLDLVEHVYGPGWLKPLNASERAPG